MIKRALISVSDKGGVVEFAQGLVELGFEVISTGGTAKRLADAGVEVIAVSDVTGFPEILDGRVKTLHPKVHGGILALRKPEHLQQLKEYDITPIDLVAVNLYPFEAAIDREDSSLAEAIENIDIGGPTMVRSAAKNYRAVGIVVNPDHYPRILQQLKEHGDLSEELRLELALEAFRHTARYDSLIANYLGGIANQTVFPAEYSLGGKLAQTLRYGENPHQAAAFYRQGGVKGACVANAKQLQGKELSFNNIVDVEAAFELVREFDSTAAIVIKHTNPCGAAVAENQKDAYRKAFDADPVSAFGGIVGLNTPVEADTAKEMIQTFLEAVIAPEFTPEALEILKEKPNLRLLAAGPVKAVKGDRWMVKKVGGGFLLQEKDTGIVSAQDLKIVTKAKPTSEQIKELLFAWKVVKHVKSNAIVVTKDGVTLGVGAGQMNRVGAAKIAMEQAGDRAGGAVLASDAFFPFRDTVDAAAKAGIKAIIQPGGSVKDEESIAACDEAGIAMVFTGMRHFKH